jgi:oxygen-independent coproporphyrinogen-3 oxidase
VDGVRWWNVKHPRTYADRLAAGESPEQGREVLTPDQRRMERIMLGVRLAEGLPVTDLDRATVEGLCAEGLTTLVAERLVLTDDGRLLADAVVRRLLD